ncbi:MAG: hypothetical protein GY724_21960 [Actinomycetia bacterium]|nr:hypothetical protein [Actinomycetes bacterium]MCP4225968.1 hypothetical protein [Actinomycetes bacterium]MCP5031412.1 hypothetical protein [Actinomycetes bacterium]
MSDNQLTLIKVHVDLDGVGNRSDRFDTLSGVARSVTNQFNHRSPFWFHGPAAISLGQVTLLLFENALTSLLNL